MHFRRLILLLTMYLAAGLLPSLAFAQDEENAIGFIEAIEGSVQIQKGDSKEDGVEGKALYEGDRIILLKGAKARLNFDDDNTINIGEESEFEIIEYGLDREEDHVLLKLWRGTIMLQVTKKYDGERSTFNLQTKSAVMGVRGTEFTVEYAADEDDTQVDVTTGEVEMGRELSGRRILLPEKVREGFAGRLRAGAPTPLLSKIEADRTKKLKEKLNLPLEPRNIKLRNEWRNRRKDLFKRRLEFRDKKLEKLRREKRTDRLESLDAPPGTDKKSTPPNSVDPLKSIENARKPKGPFRKRKTNESPEAL